MTQRPSTSSRWGRGIDERRLWLPAQSHWRRLPNLREADYQSLDRGHGPRSGFLFASWGRSLNLGREVKRLHVEGERALSLDIGDVTNEENLIPRVVITEESKRSQTSGTYDGNQEK